MTNRKQQGFTLMELLIALLVFSLLSSFAFRSISELSRTSTALSEEEQQFKFIQQGMSIVGRDLRQSSHLQIPDKEDRVNSAVGESDEALLLFGLNTLGEVKKGKNRVEYRLDKGVLQRNVMINSGGEVENTFGLIDDLEGVEIRPLASNKDGANTGVELAIYHKSFGSIVRLIQLPANDFDNIPALAQLNTLKYDQPQSTGSSVGGGESVQGEVDPNEPVVQAIW